MTEFDALLSNYLTHLLSVEQSRVETGAALRAVMAAMTPAAVAEAFIDRVAANQLERERLLSGQLTFVARSSTQAAWAWLEVEYVCAIQLAISPTVATIIALGRAAMAGGGLDALCAITRVFFRIVPDEMFTHFGVRKLFDEVGRVDLTRRLYTEHLRYRKEWPVGRLFLGYGYKATSQLEDAQRITGKDFWMKVPYVDAIDRFAKEQLRIPDLGLRFVTTNCVRGIGMFGYLDQYVKSQILQMRPNSKLILLAPDGLAANPYLLSRFEKYISVVRDELMIQYLSPLEFLLEDRVDWYIELNGERVYVETAKGLIQAEWERRALPPIIECEPTVIDKCRDTLAELGMPRDAWFVVLHVRDDGFWREDPGNVNPDGGRSADIATYGAMVAEIASAGGWVVRIGDPAMKPMPDWPNAIDYARGPAKSDWMDIALIQECRAFVGTDSGPSVIATALGKRYLVTNWPWSRGTDSTRGIFLPRMYWSEPLNRYMTIHELMDPEIVKTNAVIFNNLGIRRIHNTPEEILWGWRQLILSVEAGDQPRSAATELLYDRIKARNPAFGFNGTIVEKYLRHYWEVLLPNDPLPITSPLIG